METVLTVTAILMAFLLIGESHRIEKRSPTFVYEPPSQVEFSNSTGTVIPCSVRGTPTPMVRWEIGGGTPAKDIRGLRHARPDGSLVFSPFPAAEYKQDVHSAVYRCVASNTVGSITSRDIHIRGIVNQHYTIEVYDKFVNAGSTAVLYCHIPEHVKDFVTVTSWTEKPTGTVIQPSSVMGASGRYVMFPTGELHVRSVDTSYSYREYSCQARHRLVGEVLTSATSGRLIVREPHNKAPPQITDSKSHLIAREGELVALPCVAQGYPVPIYYWLKEETDGAYPVSTGQRITQLDGSLVIHQPKDDDSGTYICIANNSLGQDRISTELHVYAPLSASITPTRQLVHLGRPVSINCTLLGYPIHSVTWKKDSTLITTSSGRIMTNWNRLQIYSVLREDAGVYQCFVYNNMESAQTATELTLGDDTPEFQDTFREMKLHPGSLISLKCMATGSPLPQITWQLDGVPLPESHRIRLGDYVTPDGAVVSYVNISNSRIEDGGEYECNANNGVGSISYSSRVNILGPPVVRQMRNITVVAGEVLVMKCPVGGYPLEAVQWERAGVRLPYNHRQKVHKNGTLEVHHVERATDEGPYTCVARNKEGQSADSTAFVKVQVKPFIEPFTFPRTLKEQQRSSVVCTVSSGDLPIKIRWFKDDQPITENHGILIKEVVEYTSHLLFESIRLRHRGNYTCIASNEAGTVSHTATMVIHVPPRWIIEPSDSSVIKGRGIVVDCQAEGFPEPRIRWAKSDEKESPLNFKPVVSSPHLQVFENGSLSIHNARESDVGSYLCQATNGIGQGLSKVIKLHVKIAANFDTKFMAEMVEKGHNVKLKCHARGDQPIMVIWLKEKQNINLQEDPRYKLLEPVMSSGVTSELLIRQADRRDSALFTCIASNAYGQDDTNIQLIVQEPPDSPQNLQVSDRSSRTLTLRWSASYSGNSIVTEYLVQYKHKS
ncbi:Down syndrome cell adhesion molecule-like protein Dscam2, partial [Limulus polyphemus]|uniref:Down syndrome cell adhesion molecule-like protein Dscam2 n=1 Tax=Limulus polyphemus TaxID=6850 RepID=A0ABM1SWU1_LIMPO